MGNKSIKIEFTKETSVCEKCIDGNNNCETGTRGGIQQYCPGYGVWNLNGEWVFGPRNGKNKCQCE